MTVMDIFTSMATQECDLADEALLKIQALDARMKKRTTELQLQHAAQAADQFVDVLQQIGQISTDLRLLNEQLQWKTSDFDAVRQAVQLRYFRLAKELVYQQPDIDQLERDALIRETEMKIEQLVASGVNTEALSLQQYTQLSDQEIQQIIISQTPKLQRFYSNMPGKTPLSQKVLTNVNELSDSGRFIGVQKQVEQLEKLGSSLQRQFDLLGFQ